MQSRLKATRTLFTLGAALYILFTAGYHARAEELTRREQLILRFPEGGRINGPLTYPKAGHVRKITYQVVHESDLGPLELIEVQNVETKESAYIFFKGLVLYGYAEVVPSAAGSDTFRFMGTFGNDGKLSPKPGYEKVYAPEELQRIVRSSAAAVKAILKGIGIVTDYEYEAYIKKHIVSQETRSQKPDHLAFFIARALPMRYAYYHAQEK